MPFRSRQRPSEHPDDVSSKSSDKTGDPVNADRETDTGRLSLRSLRALAEPPGPPAAPQGHPANDGDPHPTADDGDSRSPAEPTATVPRSPAEPVAGSHPADPTGEDAPTPSHPTTGPAPLTPDHPTPDHATAAHPTPAPRATSSPALASPATPTPTVPTSPPTAPTTTPPAPATRGIAHLFNAGPATTDAVIVDTPRTRIRQPGDLVGMVLAALGIVVVLILSVYAHATALGVTEDVQTITEVLNSILRVAVSALNGLVTIVLPVAVIADLVIRRNLRQVFEGLAAYGGGILLAVAASWLLDSIGPGELTRSLTITVEGTQVATVSAIATGVAAMLSAIGPRSRRKTVAISWDFLFVALGVQVVMGLITLPGAIVSVLLGRLVGLAVRYISGVRTERAYGPDLAEGIRRAGITPARIVRVHEGAADADPTQLGHGQAVSSADRAAMAQASDSAARALDRRGEGRIYAAYDAAGTRWDVIVLDGDRQVIGTLARFWQTLRLRGLDRRSVISLRQASERAALLSYTAHSAGVRTPELLGIGERADSMMLVQAHPADVRCLRELSAEELDDAALDGVWQQLTTAHAAGLAHRAITSDVVLIGPEGQAWLTGWENGDVACSDLARRMDCAQLLAMLALRVGPERAVASAARVLSEDELAAIAPLLQSIAMPRRTREESQRDKAVLDQVRTALVAMIPAAEMQAPIRLVRFGFRTVLLLTLLVVALWVVLTTMNIDQIVSAVKTASPGWMIVSFCLGLTTYLGAAMSLIGFSPIKLPWWRTILIAVAGSFVALAVPGGLGPAGLNMNYLTKRRVKTPLALATVALVQVTLFVTTVVLVIVISLVSGDSGALTRLPTEAVLIVVAVVVVAGLTMTIPRVRHWVWAKIGPTLKQVWPRLIWVLGQPRKLAIGVGGNALITLGYLAAFWASLQAFGIDTIPITNVALIYLIGNTAGAAVPTPGGLGTVEFALTTGLSGAGISAAVAASAAVLFRVLTYWGRVPLGIIAWRFLQRRGDI